jgi:Rieske 2Fe-2S family protein
MNKFQGTVASYQQGARTMPGAYYTSPDILAEERETIFARQWNCVGRASTLAARGDYVLRDIAGESIIVLRDQAGTLRAFFNVCRHRGTQLCAAASGRLSETIQCPYHAWTYATDGRLIGAPHMQDVAGFDKKEYPLHAAAVAEHDGFMFVNIATDPVPFAQAFAPVMERFARYGLGALSVRHRVTYDVAANWKLVFQNYSECLHCPVIHPELAAILPYQSGANDLVEGPFLGGYMELTPPNASATLSGRACGRLVSAGLGTDDRHRAYYYALMPNMLLSIQPDYVNYYMLTPVSVDHTVVESEWMFAPGQDGDATFNPQDAIAFWDVTNRQDWDIVARSQRGIASRRYAPGPYSPRESIPAAWDREYLRIMGRPAAG